MTRAEFAAKYESIFADNEYQNITEATFRDFKDDIAQTFLSDVIVPGGTSANRLFAFTGTAQQPQPVEKDNFYLVTNQRLARAKSSFNASAIPTVNNAYWEIMLEVPAAVQVLQGTGISSTATISQQVLTNLLAAEAWTKVPMGQYGTTQALDTEEAFVAYVLTMLSQILPSQMPGKPADAQVDDVSNTFSALLVAGFPNLAEYEGYGFPNISGTVPLTAANAYLQNGRVYLKGLEGPLGVGEVGFRVAASGSRPAGPFATNASSFTGIVVAPPTANTSPVVTVSASAVVGGQKLTAIAADSDGVKSIYIKVYDAQTNAVVQTFGPSVPGDTQYITTWASPAEGSYYAKAIATDTKDAVSVSDPAVFVIASQNVTPAAPVVVYLSATRRLTATHDLGGVLLYSYQGGAFVEYTGSLIVDDLAHDPQEWRFKRAASTGYNESLVAYSPAIAAKPATPVGTATRQTSGLLVKADGTLAEWSHSPEWTSEDSPALIAFAPSAIAALSAGAAGSSDFGGVREGHLYIETIAGIETWFMFYGAGDGSASTDPAYTGNEWRIQLAKSTNRGLTWQKLGPTSIGPRTNGSGAEPQCRDMLFMARWKTSPLGDVYCLYSMKGLGPSYPTELGRIPNPSYTSDIWILPVTASGPQTTGWTYVRNDLELQASGLFDAFCAYCASVVPYNNKYYDFYSASRTNNTLNIGVSIGDTPLGPFTRTGTPLFADADVNPRVPENPKVLQYLGFGFPMWLMLLNEGSLSLGSTDSNAYVLSESLTSWNFANHRVFQKANLLHGQSTLGIPSPFYKADGQPYISDEGYLPYTYDCDPFGPAFPDIHMGRKLRYNMLEPSRLALRFNGQTAAGTWSDNFNRAALGAEWVQVEGRPFTVNGTQLVMETTPNSDVMVVPGATFTDGTITLDTLIDDSCGVGVVFRYSGPKEFYFIGFSPGPASDTTGSIHFYKKVDNGTPTGTYIEIGTGTAVNRALLPIGGAVALKLVISGTTYTVFSGTTQIGEFTDATYTGPGAFGLRSGDPGVGRRLVDNVVVTPAGAQSGTFVPTGNILIDSFDRADGPLGGSWRLVEGTNAFAIVNNQCDLGTLAGNNAVMVNDAVSWLNGTVKATLSIGTGGGVGLIWRYTSGSSFYMLDFSRDLEGVLRYSFYKKTGAGYSQIGISKAISTSLVATGATFTASVAVSGSSFSLFIGGSQLDQFSDSAYATAGTSGLRNGSSEAAMRLVNDFSTYQDNVVLTPPVTSETPYLKRVLAHSDYVAEFALEFDDVNTPGYVQFQPRQQANGDHYAIQVAAGGSLVGSKTVGGVSASLAASLGTTTTQKTQSSIRHVLRIVQQGSSLKAWLDGELQINTTDASFTSGSSMGFVATGGACRLRGILMYKAQTVTLSNVPVGASVTLRGYGGFPIATTVASSSTVQLSHTHYPVASIDVNNADVAVPAGGVYGGESYAYAA
ncbi:hypothetical protein [Hymenobacter sp. BT491]|uniref:hypothetical protein n=1 Tax=Hymenobacter sp. BT491 TaxID=2766779 RepID=UPI0016539155|nr:hypothetical protein [Hymenobacter sp. BT491]MBC6988555.1 hypothetical protein [Hymenobacter sp. BT491]